MFRPLEIFISKLTQNKDINNTYVKCLPSNLDYKSDAVRRKNINTITYDLHLNQWMEYALYFGIKNEDKAWLYKAIKPGFTIIDVGVNFGETLLNFAMLTGENGSVFGFEPMPYIFEKCKHNLKLNNFKNIVLENYALSDTKEVLAVTDPLNGNSGGTYVSKNIAEHNQKLTISATTLDEYVIENGIGKIDFIKIDVEGYETNVIKGAIETIEKFKPLLWIEICDENLKRAHSSSTALIKLIKDLGYTIKKSDSDLLITEENIKDFQLIDVFCSTQK
jgi:FkbM family methyltransferase